jgi:hypothetical protein
LKSRWLFWVTPPTGTSEDGAAPIGLVALRKGLPDAAGLDRAGFPEACDLGLGSGAGGQRLGFEFVQFGVAEDQPPVVELLGAEVLRAGRRLVGGGNGQVRLAGARRARGERRRGRAGEQDPRRAGDLHRRLPCELGQHRLIGE